MLNRVVTAYLEFAELQARNVRPMYFERAVAETKQLEKAKTMGNKKKDTQR